MDVKKLADRWNDRMLADVKSPLASPVVESGSLLRKGATGEEITAAERRLGTTLPESYPRVPQLLERCLRRLGSCREGPATFADLDPSIGLLPVGDLVATAEAVGETVDIWMEVAPDLRESYAGRPHRNREDVLELGPLQESILVSSLTSEGSKYFLCLAPTGPTSEDDESFELWDKGHSGITRYLSFADWLELSVSDQWYDPGPVWMSLGSDLDASFIEEQLAWTTSLRVPSIRRLTRSAPSLKLRRLLDSLWTESDPFICLAAAQVSRIVEDRDDRLTELLSSDEPSVALSAAASMRVLS